MSKPIPDIHHVIQQYPEFTGVHPACNAVPMTGEDEFWALVEDIGRRGLHEPLIRTADGLLLDGRTRLLACYESQTEIRVRDWNTGDPWEFVNSLNIQRRHLTVGQRAAFGHLWESEKARQAAKERQLSTLKQNTVVATLPPRSEGKSRDTIGRSVGVGGKAIDKARVIHEASPEAFNDVLAGRVVLEQAYREVRRAQPVASVAPPMESKFNRTNDNVDWAWWTWNPVTGCLHNCDYCYARDIANRFYTQKFEPTFHEGRLSAPANTTLPQSDDPRSRRVFTCSMADLFGKWVPQEWIEAVFEQVRDNPQWDFLFLTKFPQRLAELEWPDNAWVGTSVDRQYRVDIAEKAFRGVKAGVRWLSCEPLLEPLKFTSLEMFDWIVVGGQSKSSGAPAFDPPWEWIEDLLWQARKAGCRVYFKENLINKPKEQPGL